MLRQERVAIIMIIDSYSMDPIGFMTNIYIYILLYTYMSYVFIHSVGIY